MNQGYLSGQSSTGDSPASTCYGAAFLSHSDPKTMRQRADVLLIERGLFPSRAKAREAIEAGLVQAGGIVVRKPSDMLEPGAEVSAQAAYEWVSRGGLKLVAGLDHFGIDPIGLTCLDVGASTGGFTHVLVERGATRVYAVDVGQGQLHRRLVTHPRVVAMEKTDARGLTEAEIPFPPHLIVCDASFISLKLVLPKALALAAPGARLIALVKPQFEAGRAAVKKGVVRDPGIHATVCLDIQTWLTSRGWKVLGLVPSPITGGDGNVEFLIGAQKPATATDIE
ncbi:MAG: rRNA (cytidine-2-O)-methyltransferase TlyA [Hyphomicrobiales bacterium]|nr:rRNA (cytidine-2-O)-methyltransferase TlyA [Hyphomicrobiales bacterium]